MRGSRDCAIARSSPSLCRSGCAAPRSLRSRSAICTRTAALTRCACRAKAAGATLAINPHTAAPLRAYLEASGHGAHIDGPLFRPLKHNGKRQDERRGGPGRHRPRGPEIRYRARLDRGYSAHSMRATFITTALENGAQLEDVQKAAGHRDPDTTKLYDRRGYNPEKAASFFSTY